MTTFVSLLSLIAQMAQLFTDINPSTWHPCSSVPSVFNKTHPHGKPPQVKVFRKILPLTTSVANFIYISMIFTTFATD